jgi:hypothetical protein
MTGGALRIPAVVLILAALTTSPAPGGEASPPPGEGNRNSSELNLRRAVRQLEAEEFTVRRTARQTLLAAGLPAVELLQETLSSAQGHLATEGVQLLEELARSNDAAVAGAAAAALQTLAGGENAEVARMAAAALEPVPVLPDAAPLGLRLVVGGAPLLAPGQGPPFGPDGKRAVDVAADGRQVRIEEVRGGKITVRITETVDGQERTTETVAENAADLLRKDRGAYELYLKHLRGQGRVLPAGVNVGVQTRVQMSVHNGHRRVRVEENGRVTEFEDDDGRQIRMRITETDNGQETTREIAAEDLAQLRERDPKAAAEFERWTGRFQTGRLQIGRLRPPSPAEP